MPTPGHTPRRWGSRRARLSTRLGPETRYGRGTCRDLKMNTSELISISPLNSQSTTQSCSGLATRQATHAPVPCAGSTACRDTPRMGWTENTLHRNTELEIAFRGNATDRCTRLGTTTTAHTSAQWLLVPLTLVIAMPAVIAISATRLAIRISPRSQENRKRLGEHF